MSNNYNRGYKNRSAVWRFYKNRYHDQRIKYGSNYVMEDLPQPLKAARSLEKSISGYRLPQKELFFQQALLLKDYEDDYPFDGDVLLYYSTYQGLTDQELRGYFSWRTKWRKGDFCEGSFSFAFIYVYELLHLIGSSGPEDAYEKLVAFQHDYAKFNPRINSYLKKWVMDFVVYYDLDPALLADREEIQWENAVFKLSNQIQNLEDTEIMAEVLRLSGSVLQNSRLYKQYPQVMERIIARILRQMDLHYKQKCIRSWAENYFGFFSRNPIELFDRAVFFDHHRKKHGLYNAKDDILVELSPLRSYRCVKGIWYLYNFQYDRTCYKRFLNLLRTIDSLIREALNFSHAIRAKVKTKWILAVITEEIKKWQAEQQCAAREAQKKKIHIDLSQLGAIRSDADETQEKLLTEDEMDEVFENDEIDMDRNSENGNINIVANIDDDDDHEGFNSLSAQEKRYLRCLFDGQSTNWVILEGLLPSLICDSINEKLFESFQDTVIENDEIVKDYVEELKKGLSV